MVAVIPASSLADSFVPARGLRGPNAQTLWSALVKPAPKPALRRERFPLPDDDYLDLAWGQDRGGPLVLILHGLTGDAGSVYARRLVDRLQHYGFTPVVMEARGTHGDNATLRFQHGGETGDLEAVVGALRQRFPERRLAAVGYSLGGNVLLNWLAQRHPSIAAACAISVPFELGLCAMALERGFARVYQSNLLSGLKGAMRPKLARAAHPLVAPAELDAVRTLRAFDERVTAPIHGFAGAEDYYGRASSRQRLGAVTCPTLLIQALDDPFVPRAALPTADELSPAIEARFSGTGGHVAFVAQRRPRWLEEQIIGFLAPRLSGQEDWPQGQNLQG